MRTEHKIKRTSFITGKLNEMTLLIDPQDLLNWENGYLIQDAFPYLTADEREFLMTGITPNEWDAAFGETE